MTIHVYPLNRSWEVKSEGRSGKVYVSRRAAVKAARESLKSAGVGQFVVHGKDGHIKEHGVYGMTSVQDPPKRSSRAKEIARAVGTIALRRVQSQSSREQPSQD